MIRGWLAVIFLATAFPAHAYDATVTFSHVPEADFYQIYILEDAACPEIPMCQQALNVGTPPRTGGNHVTTVRNLLASRDTTLYVTAVNQFGESEPSNPFMLGPDPIPPCSVVRYDLDGDSRVSVIDALIALKGSTQGGSSVLCFRQRFDVNADGRVSVLDALVVLRMTT